MKPRRLQLQLPPPTTRAFDLAAALLALVVLAVPMAIVATLIRLTSSGPMLYRQLRIGRDGRPFSFLKFRTMRAGGGGPHVTVSDDRRITSVGRFLRRWKLDELPQLWNVVRGDMGLVGPRPEVERFVSRYSPSEREVLRQRPGLVSMAQLVYPHEADLLANCPDPEEAYGKQLMPRKIAVDLEYELVRNFWTDLRLLLEVLLMVAGKTYRIDREFRIRPEPETTVG